MIGSSYEGFTVVMALLHPHPALKVAAPESPMIDGWMGDDWFHYGAFRLANIGWIGGADRLQGRGQGAADRRLGRLRQFPRDRLGRRLGEASRATTSCPIGSGWSQHPAYDGFWQGQALDKLLAANPSNVPTLWEQGLWDQEDMYGAIHSWEALKKAGQAGNNFLRDGAVAAQPDQP